MQNKNAANIAALLPILKDLMHECILHFAFFILHLFRPTTCQTYGWTVQPRSGSPQPDCFQTPSSMIAGTVGSPFVMASISR